MARYIDWKDVVGKYADAARIGGAVEMKESFINAAEDEIDAALATRYLTPFTPVPGVVRDLCIDQAYFKMALRQKGSDLIGKFINDRIKALRTGDMVLVMSGTILETVGHPRARRFAMTASIVPIFGYSLTDSYFVDGRPIV